MAQREEIGSQAKDNIATPSILIPENEVDIVNETVEYFSGTE
jgi:hypothetical protein